MGNCLAGSNPALSAMYIWADKNVTKTCMLFCGIYYEISAVLDGELAVPCTCKPLMQDRSLF